LWKITGRRKKRSFFRHEMGSLETRGQDQQGGGEKKESAPVSGPTDAKKGKYKEGENV